VAAVKNLKNAVARKHTLKHAVSNQKQPPTTAAFQGVICKIDICTFLSVFYYAVWYSMPVHIRVLGKKIFSVINDLCFPAPITITLKLPACNVTR
jgi:hypothetical protein